MVELTAPGRFLTTASRNHVCRLVFIFLIFVRMGGRTVSDGVDANDTGTITATGTTPHTAITDCFHMCQAISQAIAGNRHYRGITTVTGTIAGNRLYSTCTIEGPLRYTGSRNYRFCCVSNQNGGSNSRAGSLRSGRQTSTGSVGERRRSGFGRSFGVSLAEGSTPESFGVHGVSDPPPLEKHWNA